MQINLLQELRYVSAEIGLAEAKKMPVYERRWWTEQMQKDSEPKNDPGKKTVDAR